MDRRVKHDVEVRRKAAELFASGMGSCTVASTLSVPLSTVKTWQHIYHAFGSEVLLTMDGKQALYTYEQKVAAARAVIEDGMTKTEVMAKFKIMSLAPLKLWCRRLKDAGVVQSMSRKGNCIDNGTTEQIFSHLKDEFSEEERGLTLSLSKQIWTHMLCTGTHKGVRLN
jgi:hypothetical protein